MALISFQSTSLQRIIYAFKSMNIGKYIEIPQIFVIATYFYITAKDLYSIGSWSFPKSSV